MSENALVKPKSENKTHIDGEEIEFLEKLIVPDLRFEEFYLNNENIPRQFKRVKM